MELKEFFKKNPKVALGFSGGVDSSYLLYAGKKYSADIKAYYIQTQFQPEFELKDALDIATQMGVDFEIVEYDSLQNEDVVANDENRCYYCKQKIFGKIVEKALEDGYTTIVDGTNASDDEAERPGMRVLKEMNVLSPIKLCNLSKEDVRRLSKKAGLQTWNKPSYSCLATRIKTGEELTAEKLKNIEAGEMALMKLGFEDFRLRLSRGEAKLQVKAEQMLMVFDKKEEIKVALNNLFNHIVLDLEER